VKTKIIAFKKPDPEPEPMTLERFADLHGFDVVVQERDPKYFTGGSRWFAVFYPSVEEKFDGILRGTFGQGCTPDEAVKEWAEEISGKLIVVDAMKPTRREIKVPKLTV
jgi:hypothetical protein